MGENLNREALLLAIEEDELDEFLMGRGLYSFGDNPFLPGDSYLDLDNAMAEIYRYYDEYPEKRIDLLLEKTMLDWLTWDSGIGVYAVFSFLSYQLMMEKEGKSPFKINKKLLISELRKNVPIYEKELKEDNEYEGAGLKEGLWEAMHNENEGNIDEYGIKIL